MFSAYTIAIQQTHLSGAYQETIHRDNLATSRSLYQGNTIQNDRLTNPVHSDHPGLELQRST